MRQIVLDTETTGLRTSDGHRIIEIACVELVNRRITGKTFHYYLNPERKIDKGAQRVHGIKDDFLLDKPLFPSIVDSFIEYIENTEMIIHNAPFDLGFLNEAVARSEIKRNPFHPFSCFDTATLCGVAFGQTVLSRAAIAAGMEWDETQAHSASYDAEMTADLFCDVVNRYSDIFEVTRRNAPPQP